MFPDTIVYLSTSYGYGSDPVLDQHVPRALMELFCRHHDCWVTGENTGIEPARSSSLTSCHQRGCRHATASRRR